ncbi:MAG: type II toxin-antitoxin system Phd/YefM family antitoxin [Terriglobales bacterium]
MAPQRIEVGVLEAKTRLSELLARVEKGQEVIITRRGRPVAKLGPASTDANARRWRRAIANLRRMGLRLEPGETIRDWIETGRRY